MTTTMIGTVTTTGDGIGLAAPGALPLVAESGPVVVSTVQAAVATALVVVGTFFLVVGTVGLLRLPDVYNRMHATSKATTLGAASLFLAGFVTFVDAQGLTSLVGIVFLFLTAPTGAHMISRAAQKMGVPFAAGATWPAGDVTPEEPVDGDDTAD
jgi:multicomponent Na+:H+ antiporter subunit G